jgi:sec-independent protein translocase protein TatA
MPMGSLSIWHWIVVVVVVLLLFGRGKISELMGDMAQGIKAFKKGMADDTEAKAEPAKSEPAKAIDHQPASGMAQRAGTEQKVEGTTL